MHCHETPRIDALHLCPRRSSLVRFFDSRYLIENCINFARFLLFPVNCMIFYCTLRLSRRLILTSCCFDRIAVGGILIDCNCNRAEFVWNKRLLNFPHCLATYVTLIFFLRFLSLLSVIRILKSYWKLQFTNAALVSINWSRHVAMLSNEELLRLMVRLHS